MPDINFIAVAVAAAAAVVTAMIYYMLTAGLLAGSGTTISGDERPPLWKIGVNYLTSIVVALVVAGLADTSGADTIGRCLLLGLVLWIGFPLTLWISAMTWENVSWRLALSHGGDWLVKLLTVAVIVGLWQ